MKTEDRGLMSQTNHIHPRMERDGCGRGVGWLLQIFGVQDPLFLQLSIGQVTLFAC